MRYRRILLQGFLICLFRISVAQDIDSLKLIDYSTPKEYIVDTVLVTGVHYLDKNILANMSELTGERKLLCQAMTFQN